MQKKVSTEAVLKAYEARDAAAKAEQELEDIVFSPTRIFEEAEIETFIRRYQQLKDIRARKALEATRLYMHLDPEDRKYVTDQWRKTSEGQRKAKGTGVRGK